MTMLLNRDAAEEYLALVRAFPLLSIRDDAHLDEAMTVIDRLTDKPDRSEAEEAYLDALTDLVETYENAHVDIPPVTGVEALRSLMEENGLKQNDLAPLFGSPSIISEVLSGKRRLALSHMEKLAVYFGLPISVFSESTVSEMAGLRIHAGQSIYVSRVTDEFSRFLAASRDNLTPTQQGSLQRLLEEWGEQSGIAKEYSRLLAAIRPERGEQKSDESDPNENKPQSTAGSQTGRP